MKFWLLLFGLIFSIPCAFAQQASYFNLGKEQFEGVQIYDVIQDNNFNYWFATDKGFYKYDCHTFQKIHSPAMKGFSAFGFVINKAGTIYCYNSNNQILKIENDTCSVFYELKGRERGPDIFLLITPEENLLVLTRTIMIFNPTGKQILKQEPPIISYNLPFHFPFQTESGEIICHYTCVNRDSLLVINKNNTSFKTLVGAPNKTEEKLLFFKIDRKTYAISTPGKQLYSFDENTYQLTALANHPLLQTNEIFRHYNVNNLLWLAGAGAGVRILGGANCEQISNVLYSQYLISDIYQDHEGNLLLSTFNNGVLVIPNLEIPDVLTLPKKQAIVSAHHDSQLGVLMGASDGQLVAFDDRKNQYQTISNSGGKPLQRVYSWPNFPYIIFDDGQIKAYHKETGKVVTLMVSSLKDAIAVDSQTIYLALNVGVQKIVLTGLHSFAKEEIQSLKIRTYSIELEPETQNFYVATSDRLKILKPDGSVEDVLFKGQPIFANDICAYAKTLYVSTQKHGILLFEKGVILRQFIPKVNQTEIEIYKLIVNNQKIYTISSQGFVVLDMNGAIITQLNMKYGFATNKIFDFEIIDDKIWISHSKGVQKININLIKNNVEKPLIKISRIEVNDESIKISSKPLTFNSNQRKFRFTISSPTLHNRENIKYHYQLVGYDNKWITVDYNNYQIAYNALSSGTYTFLVKAENQGVFSKTLQYSFTILSPFYLRWWFIASALLLFLFIVFLIYRWQLDIQRKKSAQINELNASKLTAIQSQMNPHFIFNSLNSIQDLILKGDVENSYSYITTFANMVRRTLNYSEKDFIDMEQEMELLKIYLSLEKLRFKKDLEYNIHFLPDYEQFSHVMIPPLLIQPFIENALVHGLLHKEGVKKISISFSLKDALICVIEDNGIGREKAKVIRQRQRAEHEPFSSNANHRRFEIFSNVFNGKFGYFYEDLSDGAQITGTRVTLKIPVKHKF